MEGETQVETQTETTAPESIIQQPEVQQEKPETNEKPAGFDKVEFTPEQQARVDRLYGNMKRYETDARELREINSKLIETVSQVQQEQSKVVNHLQIKDYESAENKLKEEARQAYAKGDVDVWMSSTQKIAEIAAKKSIAEFTPRQQPQSQQQPRPVSPEDAINLAQQKGDVSSEEANIYRAWVNETDPQGNLKRPWINPQDVRNTTAAFEGRAVFSNPSFQNKPFAERLREIDRRMGMVANVQGGNSVLPAGNLTRGNNTNKVAVSDYEARVAIRTKFGGSKAKSDDDHVEAWRQAKVKSQKGARK